MSVYVDDMRRAARNGHVSGKWSHLLADTSEELAAFAKQMGLSPIWIQWAGTHREHYDLTDGKRDLAISLGAIPISYPHGTGELLARKKAAL